MALMDMATAAERRDAVAVKMDVEVVCMVGS